MPHREGDIVGDRVVAEIVTVTGAGPDTTVHVDGWSQDSTAVERDGTTLRLIRWRPKGILDGQILLDDHGMPLDADSDYSGGTFHYPGARNVREAMLRHQAWLEMRQAQMHLAWAMQAKTVKQRDAIDDARRRAEAARARHDELEAQGRQLTG